MLSWSVLPECFGINLAFKQVRWLDEGYLSTALIGRGEGTRASVFVVERMLEAGVQ